MRRLVNIVLLGASLVVSSPVAAADPPSRSFANAPRSSAVEPRPFQGSQPSRGLRVFGSNNGHRAVLGQTRAALASAVYAQNPGAVHEPSVRELRRIYRAVVSRKSRDIGTRMTELGYPHVEFDNTQIITRLDMAITPNPEAPERKVKFMFSETGRRERGILVANGEKGEVRLLPDRSGRLTFVTQRKGVWYVTGLKTLAKEYRVTSQMVETALTNFSDDVTRQTFERSLLPGHD